MEINESQLTKQKSPIHINLSQNEIFSENSQNSQETPRFESEQLPSIQNKSKKIYSDQYPQVHQNKQQPKIINLNNNKISNKNQNNSPQKPPKHNANQNLQFQIKNQNNYENLSQKIKNNIINLNQNQHSDEKIQSQQQIPVPNQIQISQRQIRSQTTFQSQLHSQRQKNFDQNLKTIDQLDLLLDSNRNLKEDESIYQQSYDQPPDQIYKYNGYQFNQNIINNLNNNNSNYSQIQNQQQEIPQQKQNQNQTQNQQFQNSSQPFSQQKILQSQKIQQSSKLSQNASKFLQQSTQSQTDQMNFTLFNSNHSLESQNDKNNSLKLIEFQKANNSSQNTNFSYYDPSQNYKNKNNNNIYKKGYSYDDQSTKQSNIGSSSKIEQVQSSRKKKDYDQIFQIEPDDSIKKKNRTPKVLPIKRPNSKENQAFSTYINQDQLEKNINIQQHNINQNLNISQQQRQHQQYNQIHQIQIESPIKLQPYKYLSQQNNTNIIQPQKIQETETPIKQNNKSNNNINDKNNINNDTNNNLNNININNNNINNNNINNNINNDVIPIRSKNKNQSILEKSIFHNQSQNPSNVANEQNSENLPKNLIQLERLNSDEKAEKNLEKKYSKKNQFNSAQHIDQYINIQNHQQKEISPVKKQTSFRTRIISLQNPPDKNLQKQLTQVNKTKFQTSDEDSQFYRRLNSAVQEQNQPQKEILEYDSRSKSAAKPMRVEDQEYNINNQNQNLTQNQNLNQIHFPLITNNNFQNNQKKFKINQNALLQMKNIDISGSEFLNEFLPQKQNTSKINQNQSFQNNNSQISQKKQNNSIQQQNQNVQNQEQNQNVYKNFSEFVTKIVNNNHHQQNSQKYANQIQNKGNFKLNSLNNISQQQQMNPNNFNQHKFQINTEKSKNQNINPEYYINNLNNIYTNNKNQSQSQRQNKNNSTLNEIELEQEKEQQINKLNNQNNINQQKNLFYQNNQYMLKYNKPGRRLKSSSDIDQVQEKMQKLQNNTKNVYQIHKNKSNSLNKLQQKQTPINIQQNTKHIDQKSNLNQNQNKQLSQNNNNNNINSQQYTFNIDNINNHNSIINNNNITNNPNHFKQGLSSKFNINNNNNKLQKNNQNNNDNIIKQSQQQDKIPSDIEKQIQQQDQITQFTNRKLISMQNNSNNNNASSIMKKTAKFGEKIHKSRQLSKNENDLIFD